MTHDPIDPSDYRVARLRMKRAWNEGVVRWGSHAQRHMLEEGIDDIDDDRHLLRRVKGLAMADKKRCETCGSATLVRVATPRRPYHYKLSGLKRVFLVGIEVETCRACGMESPAIPKLGELHRIIAHHLIRKADRLAGEELRFLRKLAGISAKRFAELLRITPEHLSGAENNRRPLSRAVDKLARAVVAETIESNETRTILLQSPTEIETEQSQAQLHFSYDRKWTSAA